MDFYESTDGDNWSINEGWDGVDLCDAAYGITCDANGFVTEMYSIKPCIII